MKPLTWLLRAVLPFDTQDAIVGDLLEEYADSAPSSHATAFRRYARRVWSFVAISPEFGCMARTVIVWCALFSVACLAGVPVAVAVLLLSAGAIPFYVANRTRHFRAGLAAALTAMTYMLSLGVVVILASGLRHPPFSSLWLPAMLCTIAAAIFSLAGKCSNEPQQLVRYSR